ncbi:MAG: acyltransferase [Dyella sp.]
MLASLPGFIRIPLVMLLIVGNVVVHTLPLFALTLLKLLLPLRSWRRLCSAALAAIAESWIGFNSALFDVFARIRWHITGVGGLSRQGSYLVLCNHQSWIDIPVLQKVFNRRIPLMRFFLKSQLIWVPLMGPAWWALDFPFMKRYSKQTLARHPQLKGKDLEVTRRACEKFRDMPVTVMNFVEGTRFTALKHQQQGSAYRYLLRPRAGGVSYVLEAMGDALQRVLDVTIVYPHGPHTLFDLIAGHVREVCVHVRELPVAREQIGHYESDAAFRERFQLWINALWAEKDARIGQMRSA